MNGLALGGLQLRNQAAAVQGGVLEAVVARLAQEDVNSCASALYAGVLMINTLCAGSAEHRARALRAGAVTPIVAALLRGKACGEEAAGWQRRASSLCRP